MELIQVALAIATLLCSLVAGLVLGFAVVVMPGIKELNDHDYLQAFKVMDRVIQNNQPIFMIVWLGSAVAVIVLAGLSIWELDGLNRTLAIVASAVYLIGVQLPTITINIPLNNRLQSLELGSLTEKELHQTRESFENRWVFWNSARTLVATIVSVGLITLALNI